MKMTKTILITSLFFFGACQNVEDLSDVLENAATDKSKDRGAVNKSASRDNEREKTKSKEEPSNENPLPPVTYVSSELGWVDGENVSSKLMTLFSEMKSGEHLQLTHLYKISGKNMDIPNGITISALKGAGFDISDLATNQDTTFRAYNDVTISNVRFWGSNTPDTNYKGTHAQVGVDFLAKSGFLQVYGSNVKILNSSFEGNVGILLELKTGTRDFKVDSSLFHGGLVQIRTGGDVVGISISKTKFEDGLADGIKTLQGSIAHGTAGKGTRNVTILDSFFEGFNRDSIDTTGGFKNTIVRRTIFKDNDVSAFDLKTPIDGAEDLSEDMKNESISISDCTFIDVKDLIVVTTNDYGSFLNDTNANQFLPRFIEIENSSTYTTPPAQGRIALIKDGHSISWDNITSYSDTVPGARIFDPITAPSWNRPVITNTNYNITQGSVVRYDYVAPVINFPYAVGPQ